MSDTRKWFADNLSDLCYETKVQLRQISQDTEISTGSISNYCNDSADASITNAVKLAKYFDVSLDWLTGLEPKCRKPNADFRGVCDYVGLSDKSVEFLHSIRDTEASSALDLLFESDSFKFLLDILLSAKNQNDKIEHGLMALGLTRTADSIINGVTPENATALYYLVANPLNRDQDEYYYLYSMSKIFEDILAEILEPIPFAKYFEIKEKIRENQLIKIEQDEERDNSPEVGEDSLRRKLF